jgi:hypothetical protein
MRNTLILIGVALAAVAIGAGLYFYASPQFLNTASSIEYPAPTANASNTLVPTHVVVFRVLDTGTHAAGVSERKNYAASSEEDFAKIWKMAHGTDGTTLPKIDFSKEYVIGVFAGQKSTGGNLIAVTSVTDAGNARTVAVTLTSPGTGCMVTQSLTNPYQIVAVPLSDASLAHTDTEVSPPCN